MSALSGYGRIWIEFLRGPGQDFLGRWMVGSCSGFSGWLDLDSGSSVIAYFAYSFFIRLILPLLHDLSGGIASYSMVILCGGAKKKKTDSLPPPLKYLYTPASQGGPQGGGQGATSPPPPEPGA